MDFGPTRGWVVAAGFGRRPASRDDMRAEMCTSGPSEQLEVLPVLPVGDLGAESGELVPLDAQVVVHELRAERRGELGVLLECPKRLAERRGQARGLGL